MKIKRLLCLMFALVMISLILPAIITLILSEILRKIGWIKENDLKLDI